MINGKMCDNETNQNEELALKDELESTRKRAKSLEKSRKKNNHSIGL